MTSNDTVLHAFEDWWGTTGSELLLERQEHDKDAGIEIDAFKAGVMWERERCAKLAHSMHLMGQSPVHYMHGSGWNEACSKIAIAIRGGTR